MKLGGKHRREQEEKDSAAEELEGYYAELAAERLQQSIDRLEAENLRRAERIDELTKVLVAIQDDARAQLAAYPREKGTPTTAGNLLACLQRILERTW
jgi:hypothetical protein